MRRCGSMEQASEDSAVFIEEGSLVLGFLVDGPPRERDGGRDHAHRGQDHELAFSPPLPR
uniref:Uncharacterized protein n=1 Tax=Arundo donax TaxID=35708 RepID=A0A0A9DK01_ARUDO